ncbi:snaclec coagulation factor IX/factor X-binding protein subunit B3-like [Mizuhopecten yessoensis]|uniref:snaclec coagulation factor IX/factor X-binding protein subunit B3-like n=1 Tax=Mizuhopecten yessoensis TaxID=6573 RepID=UPI000B458967|nr:snaclec coagulation factor IX/factor X-binding protein subunit B3-like [Mizuhopecten yessoensis]
MSHIDLPILLCLVLCLGGWITMCIAGPCDHGWYYRNGTCYKFHHEKKNWIDANNTCTAQNARLVHIKYLELNTYLAVTAATVFNDMYWIGLRRTDYYEYRNFNENNATTLKWFIGEPNNGVLACVYSQGGFMKDHSCDDPAAGVPRGFICQGIIY